MRPKQEDKSTTNVSNNILLPYIGTRIFYASRKRLSSYYPSSLMMDYVVHHINRTLSDNFYFKRTSPHYHPYVLRLYYAILFWIQCLHAGHDVVALEVSKHQFLTCVLHAYLPERLQIVGSLIPLFKTLCSSQPEIETFGKVYPKLPRYAGPTRRDEFSHESLNAFFLLDVAGIFALLDHLGSLIKADQPIHPKWVPTPQSPPVQESSGRFAQTVVLKVGMSCQGCVGAVKRVLGKMEGVESYDINIDEQKVTVKGNVEPEAVFQTVSKTGKKTSFWEAETTEAPQGETETKLPEATEVAQAETEAAQVAVPAETEAKPAEAEIKAAEAAVVAAP